MQPVGEFDENYTYIIGQSKQHFSEILSLQRAVIIKDPGNFCKAVNYLRYFFPEFSFDVLQRDIGIFNYIMKERTHN